MNKTYSLLSGVLGGTIEMNSCYYSSVFCTNNCLSWQMVLFTISGSMISGGEFCRSIEYSADFLSNDGFESWSSGPHSSFSFWACIFKEFEYRHLQNFSS